MRLSPMQKKEIKDVIEEAMMTAALSECVEDKDVKAALSNITHIIES